VGRHLPDADALALVSLNGGFGEGNLHLIGQDRSVSESNGRRQSGHSQGELIYIKQSAGRLFSACAN
jgi:hypothetical protein